MENFSENKSKRLIKLMAAWCIENHDRYKFCCEFNLVGHVDWVEIKLQSGGDSCPIDTLERGYMKLNDHEKLRDVFNEMKDFKLIHDENFKPEAIEKAKEEKRLARIKRLKTELNSLEA